MNKKHVTKQNSGMPSAVMSVSSDQKESRECNFPTRFGKHRIILGVFLICIIGIAGGCSFGKVDQGDLNTNDQNQVELENSGTDGQSVDVMDGNSLEMNQVKLENSGIDGQWVGVVDGMDGKPLELNYRFRAEGTRLIGLIESQLGGGQIQEGKIDGNNIEFKLDAGEFIIMNKGVLSGDEIHLTELIGEGEIKVILKRVKR